MDPLPTTGISRRAFLTATSCAVAASKGVTALADAAAPARLEILDTHTHFYDPTRPEGVPWPPKDDPVLYRRVMPEDFRRLAVPQGVTGTVVVEASPRVEDNQWVLELAAKDPLLIGLVGHLKPGEQAFRTELKRFAANPRLRGVRVGTWGKRPALTEPRVLDDVKLLVDHDLELDVNGGTDMLEDVARLARALPGLRIVINHVANVRIDGQPPPPEWVRGMRAAAAQQNVFCKVSGLVEGSGAADGKAPAEVSFYRPVLDAVFDSFGPERLVYGSNWPVSERFAPYPVVQKIVTGYFGAKGAAALKACMAGNARRAYKLSAA